MVNIRYIAQKAGVSIATVSYTLNGKNKASAKTQERIRKIAKEAGYIPNSFARGLQTKKSDIVGLIIPDLNNTYLNTFIKFLEQYSRKAGFYVLMGCSDNKFRLEKELIHKFMSKNVDSFVIIPGNNSSQNKYKAVVKGLGEQDIPVVFINMAFSDVKTSYIAVDLEKGQYMVTRYLLDNGIRKLVFVAGIRTQYYSKVRLKGFKKALNEFGLVCENKNFLECGQNYTFEDGYDAITSFFNKNRPLPQAFVAIDDSVAMGIIKGLRERGFSVPEDISVVGCDDIKLPIIDTVPLTTLKIPLEYMVHICVEFLKAAREDKEYLCQHNIEPELVIRESVKCI
ncbi:MAG: LacI family DNA-binding transcriptional regulator [Planctomycetota bacterium]|jgi:LacI family transcriptional regulator